MLCWMNGNTLRNMIRNKLSIRSRVARIQIKMMELNASFWTCAAKHINATVGRSGGIIVMELGLEMHLNEHGWKKLKKHEWLI